MIITIPTVLADDLDVCHACALSIANGSCDGCESCAFGDADDCPDTASARQVATWGEDARWLALACTAEDCTRHAHGADERECDACGQTRYSSFWHVGECRTWPTVADVDGGPDYDDHGRPI